MARFRSLATATVIALTLAACANQSTDTTAATGTEINKDPHFATTDSQLAARLKLRSMSERREGDLLRFQAVILNDWHSDVQFRYQVLWYDAGNMLVGAESRPWHAVSLPSGSIHSIEATAPRASADHYVIQLQEQ